MSTPSELGAGAALAGALTRLAGVIDAHAASDPDISYTAKLLKKGPFHCGKKLGEEGVECALATASQSEQELAAEAADLLYHLLVALKSRGVSLDAVGDVLASREGRSGLEEKASRPKD